MKQFSHASMRLAAVRPGVAALILIAALGSALLPVAARAQDAQGSQDAHRAQRATARGAQRGFFAQGPQPSYTLAQARQGEMLYAGNCLTCHGADLAGGQAPALKGQTFRSHWVSQSPQALFAMIAGNMPPNAAGSLSDEDYADIDAYLLQLNGVKPGRVALAPAAPNASTAVSGSGASARPRSEGGMLPLDRSGAPIWGPPNYDDFYKRTIAQRTALFNAMSPVTDALLRRPPPGDWLMWRRDYASLGFSPLTQITAGNVQDLRVAWAWSLHVSPDETTPLVHDGVLFIASGDAIQALNAVTGDLLWEYVRALPGLMNHGQRSITKSLAIYQNEILAPTADGHVVALDARSGEVLWDHAVLSFEQATHGARIDGGPLVVNGKVIMGISCCAPPTIRSGFIFALDERSGQESWRFDTVARPGQPGGDSWNGAPLEERYGGSVWTVGSFDPTLDLVYFGTGNTYDTATLLQPHARHGASDAGAYTDSTLALDPNNGNLSWYYQHARRDVWDLDWVFEQSLIDLPVNGRDQHLLVTGGKIAIFDALDRATGRYLFSKDAGLQNVVAAINPITGEKTYSAALTPQAGKNKLLCPHPGGARSWPATAYNPQTHILYVPLIESCADFTWIPRSPAQTAAGGADIHFVLHPRPDSDGNFGRIEAIDLQNRRIVWTDRQRAPTTSSVLGTAGGVLFEGGRDRMFRAYDQSTGKMLWETRLNAVPSSSPITYSVGGTQFVAVVAGGGGADESTWPVLTPEIVEPSGGTTLWIFRLPERRAAK